MRFVLLLSAAILAATAFAQDRTPVGLDMTNLPAQKIGVDDLLLVRVYDSPDLTRTVRVSSDGTIRMPMLRNPIAVRGLMPIEIEKLVADAFRGEQLLVDPFVTVSVAEYHSRPISVNGEVKTPVVFQAVGNVKLLEALAKAGGLSPTAGGDIIVTKPNGDTGVQSITRIPVKALIAGTDPQLNLTLIGGEEIRVPSAGTVVVSGNVRDPGVFPVQESGTTTVMTAIAQAKGLADFQPKIIYILRPDDLGVTHEIEVDLKSIMARKKPDVVLQARDVLHVPLNTGAKTRDKAVTILTGTSSAAATALIYTKSR
ncbi:MAG: polysaccharide export protein [Bryobacterales bacterium]|jgi:polysaccharide export outer membrane protein|nr:polysaccharide export protein [Bryobacterales bacterium]